MTWMTKVVIVCIKVTLVQNAESLKVLNSKMELFLLGNGNGNKID